MKMFTSESLEPVEFKSSWRKERLVSEAAAQTGDIQTDEVGCQSWYIQEEGTQTEEDNDQQLTMAQVDEAHLAQFLLSVEPMIAHCLFNNIKTRAFEDFDTSTGEEATSVTCVHTLTHSELSGELQVTGLSWNATGSTMAVSYGRYDHEDWCTHRAAVATWNLDRRSVKEDKPDTVIDSACCVMCLEFHPENPAWLVGGNFNGEVLVWDLSQEDDLLLATSGIGDDAHREPVTRVHWIKDTSSKKKRYNVVSIGGDGKILVWKVDPKRFRLKLLDGFVVMAQSLPRGMKVRGVRGDKEIGVTSLCFSHEDPDTFLVGSESGCIFRCSMHAKGSPAGSHIMSSIPLRSPVTFTFNPHHGPVHAVDCSRFHRHAFVSSGQDQCLRVYNLLQAQPVATIEPGKGYLYAASWSPVSPTVFATTTESGHLLLYDLSTPSLVPTYTVEASPAKQPVFCLQFNNQQKQLLATGDAGGSVRVFKLGKDLISSSAHKIDHLENLISTGSE
ncbi:cytoplasmic dynein 2 intermediate chain 2-like [Babylonia areolata]|uniref:cytoplasmic dynein 2 intermediate chain 2-like n=1 Tax=Babylonia areolata TaxID=304850 RepID=UPI003FD45E54